MEKRVSMALLSGRRFSDFPIADTYVPDFPASVLVVGVIVEAALEKGSATWETT